MTNPHPLTEVEACPFCGSAARSLVPEPGYGLPFCACTHCTCEGPKKLTEAEAITAWNTRSATTSAQPSTEAVKLADAIHTAVHDWARHSDDPEFLAAWQTLGFQYSESNIEKVHIGWRMAQAVRQSPPLPLEEALRLFVGAAYPVSSEINPRGHNWSEAYLDQALENARALSNMRGTDND